MLLEEKIIYYYLGKPEKEIKQALLDLLKLSAKQVNALINKEINFYSERLFNCTFNNENNEFATRDRQVVYLLDIGLTTKFINKPEDNRLADEVSKMLQILASATNNLAERKALSTFELSDIINGKNETVRSTSVCSFALSIGGGKYRHDIAMDVMTFLSNFKIKKTASFYEMVVLQLSLNIVWNEFSALPRDSQSYLVINYLYISIAMGIPVKNKIKDFLFNTYDAVDYVLLDKFLFDSINKNKEKVIVGVAPTKEEDFLTIIDHLVKESSNSGNHYVEFINKICKFDKQSPFFKWLAEIVEIYFALQNSSLISNNVAGEKVESDIYQEELEKIIEWFLVNDNWIKIVNYYKGQKPLVPFKVFFEQLVNNVDLEKNKAIEKILAFSNFLINNKVLAINQELILFSESDNQFHWNEEILTSL